MSNVVTFKNPEQDKEKLILKSLLTWITIKFANVHNKKFKGLSAQLHKEIIKLEQGKKIAAISSRDAWVIEKNALLFNNIANDFMKEFLSKEFYDTYGQVVFGVDRKAESIEIALIPANRNGDLSKATSCLANIVKDSELFEKYKETDKLIGDGYIDIIPILNIMTRIMLSDQHNTLINKLFTKYKDNTEVIKYRSNVEAQREKEDENIRKVLKAIHVQGSRVNLAKIAIVLHTVINIQYSNGTHLISKIRYDSNGNAIPVINFTRVFYIDFMQGELDQLKDILAPMIPSDIKIKVHKNMIAFTTTNINLENGVDIKTVLGAKIQDESTLNYMFDKHVAPNVDLDNVYAVMNRVLFEKYKNQYF